MDIRPQHIVLDGDYGLFEAVDIQNSKFDYMDTFNFTGPYATKILSNSAIYNQEVLQPVSDQFEIFISGFVVYNKDCTEIDQLLRFLMENTFCLPDEIEWLANIPPATYPIKQYKKIDTELYSWCTTIPICTWQGKSFHYIARLHDNYTPLVLSRITDQQHRFTIPLEYREKLRKRMDKFGFSAKHRISQKLHKNTRISEVLYIPKFYSTQLVQHVSDNAYGFVIEDDKTGIVEAFGIYR